MHKLLYILAIVILFIAALPLSVPAVIVAGVLTAINLLVGLFRAMLENGV